MANNFYFSIMLQLSESTDIVGFAVNCLQLFTRLFKPTVEIIRNRLMELPTQDFRWTQHVVDSHIGTIFIDFAHDGFARPIMLQVT